MKHMKNPKIIAQGAIIAALYVVLCLIFAPISYGEVQVRIAECLTILPVYTSAAVPGLFVGCILANVIGGGCILPDIIFGSIATLIGAWFTRKLRKKKRIFAVLPPILSNTVIIPFILRYGYGVPLSLWVLAGYIAIGEIIGCGVLGLILAAVLDKGGARRAFK